MPQGRPVDVVAQARRGGGMPSETRPAKVRKWTDPALRVLRERYLTRRGDEVLEAPEGMCGRVAQSIAAGEARYGRSRAAVQEVATAFYEMMVDGYFLPNSPTLMNAGKNNGLQYSACYVLPVGDSMEEIFDAVKDAAIIHKSGGGCIAGDTRVWTTFCGLEPIEVLVNRATADGRRGEPNGAGVAFDVCDLNISDRKSTRLNSSHRCISYAVFCLKKKKKHKYKQQLN